MSYTREPSRIKKPIYLILRGWSTTCASLLFPAVAIKITPSYLNELLLLPDKIKRQVLSWKTHYTALMDQTPYVLRLSSPSLDWREPNEAQSIISELNDLLFQYPVLEIPKPLYLSLINSGHRRQIVDTQFLQASPDWIRWEGSLIRSNEKIYSSNLEFQQLEDLSFPKLEQVLKKTDLST